MFLISDVTYHFLENKRICRAGADAQKHPLDMCTRSVHLLYPATGPRCCEPAREGKSYKPIILTHSDKRHPPKDCDLCARTHPLCTWIMGTWQSPTAKVPDECAVAVPSWGGVGSCPCCILTEFLGTQRVGSSAGAMASGVTGSRVYWAAERSTDWAGQGAKTRK